MATLPATFADLEPYAAWSLPTEKERFTKRIATSMEELEAFYDAALPRLDDAVAFLDQFDLLALPADASRLIWMYYSLMTVSFPVEVWRQPRVPDSGASSVDCVLDLKP
ncbi:MAG TPA: hypothetical protein VHX15_12160 [Frankiaceae bacterium]|jgi:hypothetical protein|nr:hypothetical protein [Frankiaceae bacterium]